jgi:hypothetical protein
MSTLQLFNPKETVGYCSKADIVETDTVILSAAYPIDTAKPCKAFGENTLGYHRGQLPGGRFLAARGISSVLSVFYQGSGNQKN